MSSKAGSTVATALVSAPLGALAMMAVFGIPQFTSVVASPEAEETTFDEVPPGFEEAAGRARPVDELFRDYGASNPQAGDPRAPRGDGRFPSQAQPGGASADPFSGGAGVGPHSQDQYAVGGAAGGSRAIRPGDAGVAAANNRAALDAAPSQMGWPNNAVREAPATEGGPFGNAVAAQPQAVPQRQAVPENRPLASQPATVGSLTWKQAVRKLNELGINTYHLERGSQPETFLFVCLFSPGDDPRVTQRFEAESSEPLEAVAEVLRQIEQWLQRRFGERQQAVPVSPPFGFTR